MNKKLKIIIASIMLVITIISGLSTAFASDYYTNLPESEVEDIFNLDFTTTIADILVWAIDKETYILVENKGDGSYAYWFNTPNTQTILFNYVDSLLPVGYQGSGIDPWQIAEYKKYEDLMQNHSYTTAQKKYGFDLPNPTYVGEYPRISMSLMGVLVESNPVKFFIKKIGAILFGGSLVSPPDDKTLSTLYYASPNDYSNSDNSFEKWIELYWDSTMQAMEDGQILLDKNMVDSKGFDSAGMQWIKVNIIDGSSGGGVIVPTTVGNINGVNTPRDISLKLQENCGINYLTVVKNIVLVGINKGVARPFEATPKRIMPYQKDTLRNFDRLSLVDDPRAKYVTNIFGIDALQINFKLSSLFSNPFTSFMLSSAGSFSKWSIRMNKFTNFSLIDPNSPDMKIDATILWRSPISMLFITLVLIILVFTLIKNVSKLAMGKKGIIEIVTRSLSSFIIVGFLSVLTLNPEKIIDITKSFGNLFFNMGSQMVMSSDFSDEFISQGAPTEDVVDCAYWIPYFGLWSKYHTSSGITDKSNKVVLSNINNEPEQQENPTYGSPVTQASYIRDAEFNGLWSLLLAESFTNGFKIDNNAYRVVDHFLAPRISYIRPNEKGDGVNPIITSRINENYKGKIQKSVDIGIYLFIIIIFLAVFIKFLLFLEFIYELLMLQVHIALSSISPNMIKRTFKEFGASLLRVGLWDIVISLLILISINTDGFLAIMMAVVICYLFMSFVKKLISSNSIWKPKIISAGKDLIDTTISKIG